MICKLGCFWHKSSIKFGTRIINTTIIKSNRWEHFKSKSLLSINFYLKVDPIFT